MNKIFLHALILAFIALLPACALLEKQLSKPSVNFKQTNYQHMSLNEGVLKSRIQLTNPNNFGLPIHGITYNLTLNDRKFAQSQMSLDRKIPANGTIEFDLPITVRYKDLASGIAIAFTSKRVAFRLTGEVDFGLIRVPYQKTGKIQFR